MGGDWGYVNDIMVISLLMGIAMIIKKTIKPLNRILIPNSVLAGFLGMAFGPSGLGLINFSFDRLGNLVYHLMAIGFIAIALKKRQTRSSRSAVNTGFLIAISYAIQGIVGFGIAMILVYTFFPNLFVPFGLLLPLGFAQGPGQAYSMGSQWEALGFANGGTIGLTIATIGFLWAAFGGVAMLNIMVRRKKSVGIPIEKPKIVERVEALVKDYEFSDIDGMTIQVMSIGSVYLVTYLFLKYFTGWIGNFGTFGETFAQVLWGFHFVIGVIFAFSFRRGYDIIRKKKKIEYLNSFLLQRVAGIVFDYMVAASIAAISLELIKEYIVPIFVITTVGGIVTMLYTIYFSKRIYKRAVLEHIVTFFGMHTGTISTGIALLREVDPQFESGTAEDMVIGSGLALFLGLPLMIIINIPILGYKLGKPSYYLYTLGALALYFGLLYIFWFLKVKRSNSK
ncbi:MAG: sodium:glutamate symporter [Kosmotoga sp.]|uniref:sodium:glutamate symporter n=1 Tax=Kosmotoga sp. TaxID=1955248 RepID=UPI001D7E89D4|nr:sodium:glutamate symporter [Kosmotoga sp.]MBO8166535.1 sodium:glutamate symporter [Kosmotoga sp.]MCD6159064.1 sodium:glutamate symporter [Kosmotoga sp.]